MKKRVDALLAFYFFFFFLIVPSLLLVSFYFFFFCYPFFTLFFFRRFVLFCGLVRIVVYVNLYFFANTVILLAANINYVQLLGVYS